METSSIKQASSSIWKVLLAATFIVMASGYAQAVDWVSTGSMETARTRHTATLLPNGKVLVAGGDVYYYGPLNTAELYNGAAPLANAVVDAGPATLWIGLKNSDDQGTQFDLKTELYKNGALISEGKSLCITGVTRNPSLAKEATVVFGPVSNGD